RSPRHKKTPPEDGGVSPTGPALVAGHGSMSGEFEIDRLRALAHAVRLDVEGDLLAIGQMADAGRFERGHVHEHVLRPTLRGDEAEALRGVEEFYGASLAHCGIPFPVSGSLEVQSGLSLAVRRQFRIR